jgi:hypothetical protein
MPSLRFIQALTEESKEQISEIYHGHADFAFTPTLHSASVRPRHPTQRQWHHGQPFAEHLCG